MQLYRYVFSEQWINPSTKRNTCSFLWMKDMIWTMPPRPPPTPPNFVLVISTHEKASVISPELPRWRHSDSDSDGFNNNRAQATDSYFSSCGLCLYNGRWYQNAEINSLHGRLGIFYQVISQEINDIKQINFWCFFLPNSCIMYFWVNTVIKPYRFLLYVILLQTRVISRFHCIMIIA